MTSRLSLSRQRFVDFLLQQTGLSRDFSLAFSTNIVLMGLGLLTSTLQARLLGPTGRGELAAIQLGVMFLLALGHLGIPTALVYYTGREQGERTRASQYISTAWALMVPQSLLWIGIGWFGLPLLLRNEAPAVLLYGRLFLLLIPFAYLSQAGMALQGMKSFGPWSLMRLQKPLLYAIVLVGLGVLGWATPYSLTVASLVLGMLGTGIVVALLRSVGIRSTRPSISDARRLLAYGLRSVAGSVPEEMNSRLDQLLMVLWLSTTDLGLYVVAVGWSLMFAPLFQAAGSVLFPYVAALEEPRDQYRLFARSVRSGILVAVVSALLLLGLTPWMLPLLFGEQFRPAVPVAMLLVVAGVVFALRLMLANGLRGIGRPESSAYAEVLSLAMTITLLILLLPRYGIMGAALASLAAYSVSALMLLWAARRYTGLTARLLLVPRRQDLRYVARRLRGLLNRGREGPEEIAESVARPDTD